MKGARHVDQNPYSFDCRHEIREQRSPDGGYILIDPKALAVGDLAHALVGGYYSHIAAIAVASHPRASELRPERLPDQIVSTGAVRTHGGEEHCFDFVHYLNKLRDDPFTI